MKNISKLMLGILVLSGFTARAQVGILWDSTTYFLQEGGNSANYPADYLGADAVHILIWSQVAPPNTNYAQPGTGIGSGEFVLWSSAETLRIGDVRTDSGRFDYSNSPLAFDDSDVGGADINDGYIYSRIFQNSTISGSDWYYQSEVFLASPLGAYDPLSVGTALSHTTSDALSQSLREMGVGSGMYQVIPEPTTFGFLLIGGAMLWIRRLRRG